MTMRLAFRYRPDPAPDAAHIAYFGDTGSRGFLLLLDALGRLAADIAAPPFHLVAFGPGVGARAELERRGLSHCVESDRRPADGFAVLRPFDLLVVPSPSPEGARAAVEAMKAGVPVLGVDAPEMRELLRGTPSRLVVPDAGALRHGLDIALSRPWTEAARAYAPAARARFVRCNAERRGERRACA